ncbi:MAG TPA: SDR family NAD(P)-dependent oxidoreductase [Burkholderiaceae bacterium]|nr:SDR family NAD(P)-dependent oxidoreductase [Burkholderiaceae bacterium]
MTQPNKNARRVALITGSGRGIGAATAKLAAARGFDVAVNYVRNADAAEQVADEIRAAGAKAIAICADTADPAQVGAMFERIDAELGPVSALVNNAGITGKAGRLERYGADEMRRVIDVNVLGVLLCSQQAARRMSTRHGGAGGTIVNVSSMAATLGGANTWIPYAAAKGAVNTLTVGMSRELAAEGIAVNAVLPGLVDTEIHAEAGVADRLKNMLPQIPIGRIGTADECAQVIVWLMADAPAYMTGGLLPVSGGR